MSAETPLVEAENVLEKSVLSQGLLDTLPTSRWLNGIKDSWPSTTYRRPGLRLQSSTGRVPIGAVPYGPVNGAA